MEASATTVIVGAFARVEVGSAEEARAALSRLEGVSLFDLDEPGKVGLLLEANDEEGAHRRLMGEIRQARGVLGVWPVYLGSAGTGQE